MAECAVIFCPERKCFAEGRSCRYFREGNGTGIALFVTNALLDMKNLGSPGSTCRDSSSLTAARVSGWYCVVAGSWILLSDKMLDARMPAAWISQAQSYKGLGFVTITAALLYFVLRHHLWRWETENQARKRAEEEMRQLNLVLEKKVTERTVQLAAKSLELENFCHSVSHDLKSPLRGIEGYTRLLLTEYRDKLDAEGRDFLQHIESGTIWMDKLIDDLLAYSKLERRTLKMVPVNLRGLIERELARCRGEDRKTLVTVDMDAGLDDLKAESDPSGLAVAFRNLLENAFKFTATIAEPRIEIRARILEGRCLLSVSDNGVGFDPRHSEKIFEIFQRLHRTDDYPGTGIGLAMVRKAMDRLGGRVWAESLAGRGATFFLEIPLASAHPSASLIPITAALSPS